MGDNDRRRRAVWSWTHAGPTGLLDEIWPQMPTGARTTSVPQPSVKPQTPAPARPAQAAEPRVHPDRALLELPDEGDGCGNGSWCRTCRDEIRQEALRWIRELNAPSPDSGRTVAGPPRTWHSELLLGNS